MTCHVARRRRYIHQPPVCLAPRRRVSHFYFPHAIQNGLFNISHTTASSTSVPVPPLHATKPSARRISSKSLSSHVFMRTSTSIQALSLAALKKSAVTPVVFPPASFAPRDTASITPP